MEQGPDAQSDLLLVERCLQGDHQQWEVIVYRYQRLVYNLAYRFTGRFDRAEDLTQEIFIKIYRSLASFEEKRGEFKNWVMVMARNHLIDHIRKEKRGWMRFGGTDELEKLDYKQDAPDPAKRLEQQERAEFVHDCLRQLSPDLRGALVMREIEGCTYEEISDSTRVPLGTVKSRINRARIELARIMNLRKMQLVQS